MWIYLYGVWWRAVATVACKYDMWPGGQVTLASQYSPASVAASIHGHGIWKADHILQSVQWCESLQSVTMV